MGMAASMIAFTPLLAVVVAPVADIESRPVSYSYPGPIYCVVWLAPVLAHLIAAALAFLGHGRSRSWSGSPQLRLTGFLENLLVALSDRREATSC
jgi:hypothetical protein